MLEWSKVHMRYKEVRSESLALSHNRKISCEELARHNTGGDCWMSFQGVVYDITPFLDFHPQGRDVLIRNSGREVWHVFKMIHRKDTNPHKLLEYLKVGHLVKE